MSRTLQELASLLGGRVTGDGSVEISGVASLSSAKAGDLVFVEDVSLLSRAEASNASAILACPSAEKQCVSKPVLIVENPRLSFVRAASLLYSAATAVAGVHSSAIVAKTARLAVGVTVEAYAVIGENAEIGTECRIGAGAVIGAGVRIGEHCRIYPRVTIYPSTRLGNRVIVHAGAVLGSDGFGYVRDPKSGKYENFPQIGRLEIEDDVEIGANATVDRGALDATIIRRGTKLDNLVHVGHNVQIGQDVVIAAQTGVSGSSVIEDGVIVGGQVGIADHVRIESGAILGAQSGIPSKKVIRGKGIVFWGTPARPIREYLKELAVLARLTKRS
jgi:UDP-3-O-[3-hydroxymyristoyl] glucosamine N-acyltransferase